RARPPRLQLRLEASQTHGVGRSAAPWNRCTPTGGQHRDAACSTCRYASAHPERWDQTATIRSLRLPLLSALLPLAPTSGRVAPAAWRLRERTQVLPRTAVRWPSIPPPWAPDPRVLPHRRA